MAPHVLRVNPGGGLTPPEIVGRDRFVARMWSALERQSVVLTAERRMGKTSVLSKMLAEPALARCVIKRNLHGVSAPDEFVRYLLADTESAAPGVLKHSLRNRLSKVGVKRIDVSALGVEFEPISDRGWKDVAEETFAVLDRDQDVSIVFLWDELPHMLANIRDHHGALVAREVLDLLRASRETYPSVRMVFSGSLGLHHIVDELRAQGGMWVPTHDMAVMDLPPLAEPDALYLARELLVNEMIACDNIDVVTRTIVEEVDRAPYYVHHTVDQILNRQRTERCGPADAALVRAVVDETLRDAQDPWQLQHYVDRLESYYPGHADVAKAILDVVAEARGPLTLQSLHQGIGAHLEPPASERLRDLLGLLCKDHYLEGGPTYAFRLSLVKRAWLARRPPL
jgi:hypothetical protein